MKIVNNNNLGKGKISHKRWLVKVIRKLYKPCAIIVGIQLMSLPLIINYNRSTIKYALGIDSRQELSDGLKQKLSVISNYKLFALDIFRSLISNRKLEKVDLKINLKNITRLNCRQIDSDNCNKGPWVNGKLSYKGKDYRIKLRPKGMRKIHKLGLKKMSLRIDLKDDMKLEGMEDFSLQMPVIRGYDNELHVAKLVSSRGILAPKHFYIRMYINGEYVGIRHIEEVLGKELIERQNKRYGPLFSLDTSYGDDLKTARFKPRDKKYWEGRDKRILNESLTVLERMRRDPTVFGKYFNQEKWGKFIGMSDIFQTIHGTLPKSVGFYLNPVDGLFEPIYFDGHYDRWHINTRIADLGTFGKDEKVCNKKLRGSQHAVNVCKNLRWYEMLFGGSDVLNTDFYLSYFKTLEELSSEEFIKDELEDSWSKFSVERGNLYREFWRSDEFFQLGITPYIAPWSQINSRLRKISKEVSIAKESKPIVSIDLKNLSEVSFTNNSSRLPQIVKLKCEGNESYPIILVKGFKKSFNLNSLGKCNFQNTIYTTNNFKSESKIDTVKSVVVVNEKKSEDKTIYGSKPRYTQIFKKGSHVIDKDIEFKSANILFAAGSSICIKENASLSFKNSSLLFGEDTSNEEVEIIGCNLKGGSLIIKDSTVEINSLKLNNLSSPKKSLLGLSAGMNIINSQVNFDKIKVLNSKSEDGINLIESQMIGRRLIFENISSDALDSDNSLFSIKSIGCNSVGNDCLDLSSSIGEIKDILATNAKDKAVSIGEKSLLEIDSLFVDRSDLGLVVKDESNVTIRNYNFTGVQIPIAAYIKKNMYSPPSINIKEGNTKSYFNNLVSEDSKVYINGKRLRSKLSSYEIINKLYGNEFGVKTKR